MKKYLLGASAMALAVSLSGAAFAADLAPEPTAYDWSGFYLGLNAGVAINNSNVDSNFDSDFDPDLRSALADDIEDNSAAFTGGGEIGYNWQMESFVIGAEADFNFLGFDDSSSQNFDFSDGEDTFNVKTKLSLESNWYGTLRARLGFAADNLLIYGTGGLAYGEVEAEGQVTVDDGDTVWKGTASDTAWGWTIGAGAEYAIDQNWIVGAEYLYVDLGSVDFDIDSSDVDFGGDGDGDFAFNVVRATLKYKF